MNFRHRARKNWPSKQELAQIILIENDRAELFDEPNDLICDCGEPSWCCVCEEIAKNLGYYKDGTPYICIGGRG